MTARTEHVGADDLAWLGVDELGSLLRTRELSPIELITLQLSRIDSIDAQLNAFITVTHAEAVEAATKAEAELVRGEHRSPIHGIPVGLKDAIDMASVRCTFGSRILSERRSPGDADAVRGLRAAGAVIAGKQNLHEFAFGITGENPHYGDVTNPWDPQRITGGSSGGTAAAVAAGLTPVGVGTDTGGSVRIPAAMCGVVGLKPTYDVISRGGVLPLAGSLDHVGPIGRSVVDCFHLLDAMLDPEARDLAGSADGIWTRRVRRAAAAGIEGMRVGIPRAHFFDGLEPTVDTAVRRAINAIEELGAKLVEVSIPHAVHAQVAAAPVMCAEAATWHDAWLRDRPDDYGSDVLLRLRQGALTRAVDYLKAQKFRTLLRRDFVRAFEGVDVIVSPTVPITPPLRGHTLEPAGALSEPPRSVINRLTVPANLTGFPAITVPCSTGDHMPVGLQVMGPAFGEVTIGTLALAYQHATDWHSRRPPLPA